jgi:serine protease AprX
VWLHRPAALVVAAALAVAGLGSLAPPAPAAGAAGQTSSRVVGVAAADASAARAGSRARVRAPGGHITRDLPLVGGFAATVPDRELAALSADPAVRSVTPDAPIQIAPAGDSAKSTSPAPTPLTTREPNSVCPQALRADRVWQAGDQGQGVTVALVDTGVTAGSDLAGRLMTVHDDLTGQDSPCENLSGEPTCYDNYGDGTFVAGIIAGNGAASGGIYSGVAPQADLVAVKVAGADGSTHVSNVLAAIQWVVSFKSRYHIWVLNLSLATDSTQRLAPGSRTRHPTTH